MDGGFMDDVESAGMEAAVQSGADLRGEAIPGADGDPPQEHGGELFPQGAQGMVSGWPPKEMYPPAPALGVGDQFVSDG
jgi:hypothetical protein